MSDRTSNAGNEQLQRKLRNIRRYLEQIRICQVVPEPERTVDDSQLRGECGYVYLIQRGELGLIDDGVFKIGKTRRNAQRRRNELQRTTNETLRIVAQYATVAPFKLERALHNHYDRFRMKRNSERQKGQRRNRRGELFQLTSVLPEVFRATAAEVERWVLREVEARLELQILELSVSGATTT